MRLWVDTDVGTNPDDAIALLAAVAHPAVDLIGVSTVGVDAPWRAEVARGFLPPGTSVVAGPDATVAALRSAEPDAVVAIGPLTNLAAAARAGWRPAAITVMGGMLVPAHHRGVFRHTESNFAADPEAAAVVLAGPPATIVPIDATLPTDLSPEALGRILDAAPVLRPAVAAWLADAPPDESRVVRLHDPAALLTAVGDQIGAVATEWGHAGHRVVARLDGDLVRRRVAELLSGPS